MSTITPALVSLDVELGADKEQVLRALAARFVAEGRAGDAEELFAAAWAREEQDATGLPGGIAIPHAKTATVNEASLAFARLKPGVDFGGGDLSDIVFMIAAPDTAAEEHLAVLSQLARHLMDEDFLAALRAAATADEAVAIVRDAIGEGSESEAAAAPAASVPTAGTKKIVAVTACATGIAHTYMAADGLTKAAQEAGVEFHVETQGSSGYEPLDPQVIADADAVIFAVDVDVREPGRFGGKPVIRRPVKAGIEHAAELIDLAVAASGDPNAERVSGSASVAPAKADESFGKRIQRILMTGVSYMIPFVAGGGLLMALGFLLGGYEINGVAGDIVVNNALWNLPDGGLAQYLGAVSFAIGNASMAFLVPALAGYIAFAIADRPGIAPGFVAGSVALLMSAGFIGGIVGGLLAGLAAWWLGNLKVWRWVRGLMPVVIIPLLASIFASGLLLLVLGGPIAALMNLLEGGLTDLANSGLLPVVGIILGLMMCFDLGGPINKVAYAFAVASLADGSPDNPIPYYIMGAVMISGMVPPLGMALASTVFARRKFTAAERQNGIAAWPMGLAFISEGAIPFAAADPLRVIPASMVGGAVTGFLAMLFHVGSQAPHGGLFVAFAISPIWGFLVALLAGTVITAAIVSLLKKKVVA